MGIGEVVGGVGVVGRGGRLVGGRVRMAGGCATSVVRARSKEVRGGRREESYAVTYERVHAQENT